MIRFTSEDLRQLRPNFLLIQKQIYLAFITPTLRVVVQL